MEKTEDDLERLKYSVCEIGCSSSRILREHIDKEGISYFTNNKKLLEHLEFAIGQWKLERSQSVIRNNLKISEALNWFVQEGIWVNLNQIKRSMDDYILRAVKNDGSEEMIHMVSEVTNIDSQFQDMSIEDKKLSLELLSKHKEQNG